MAGTTHEKNLRKEILSHTGLGGLYEDDPGLTIYKLGNSALPVVIDIFSTLERPQHEEVQPNILLEALDHFASDGKEEAIRFIQKVADAKVPLRWGTADNVILYARDIIKKYSLAGTAIETERTKPKKKNLILIYGITTAVIVILVATRFTDSEVNILIAGGVGLVLGAILGLYAQISEKRHYERYRHRL